MYEHDAEKPYIQSTTALCDSEQQKTCSFLYHMLFYMEIVINYIEILRDWY